MGWRTQHITIRDHRAPGLMAAVIWLGVTVILVIVDAFGVSTAFRSVGGLTFWRRGLS